MDDFKKAKTRDEKLLVWNVWAEEVARDVQIYRRPTFLPRPATIPDQDLVAWGRLSAASARGSRAPQGDQEMLKDFVYWKRSVMQAEMVATKRLTTLVAAVYWSERIDANALQHRIASLRDFIRKEYGVSMPRPLPDDHDALAKRWACDRKLLPVWMMTMERPRLFRNEEERDAGAREARRDGSGVPSGVDMQGVRRVIADLDVRRDAEGGSEDG